MNLLDLENLPSCSPGEPAHQAMLEALFYHSFPDVEAARKGIEHLRTWGQAHMLPDYVAERRAHVYFILKIKEHFPELRDF